MHVFIYYFQQLNSKVSTQSTFLAKLSNISALKKKILKHYYTTISFFLLTVCKN